MKTAVNKEKTWLRDTADARIASPAMIGQAERSAPLIVVDEDSTLTEFFEHWFLPVVLAPNKSSAATIRLYRDTLTWWAHLTGDPPIRQIDDLLCAAFVDALRNAGFRRGPNGDLRRLAHNSVAKTLRTLRAMLGRLGPRLQPTKPTAKLLSETPIVPCFKAVMKRKGTFTLDQARAIAGACDRMEFPEKLPERFPAPIWWKARLALLYFTGLRRGTAFALRWRHLERDGDNWWINVPSSLVPKTGKATRIAAHPQLISVLKRMHWQRGENHLLTPEVDVDHFAGLHYELQRMAGLAIAECHSLSVWRRLHGQLIGEMGLKNAQNLARVSLDHSDVRTTDVHYVELVNGLRLQLPPLWPDGVGDQRQLTLFGSKVIAAAG